MKHQDIRVLCVDDHRLMREGIVRIIEMEPGVTVVAEGATGEEAVERFTQSPPRRHADGPAAARHERAAGDPPDPRSSRPTRASSC